MDDSGLETILGLLHAARVELRPGLTDAEIARVEQTYSFRFPPDLRALLARALPLGPPFPDWRDGDEAELRYRLARPADGICFDIEHANFWMPAWGPRPPDLAAAFQIARQAVRQAPVLIPVNAHRYLPADPPEAGNPVFSVHQTDIIWYGEDLVSYFVNEFTQPRPVFNPQPTRPIRFWNDLVNGNY